MSGSSHTSGSRKTGSVMVIGGGVAGLQAALDLSAGGHSVYIVESSPALGGIMSRLDKTFPTNDCSMCLLAPWLVSTGRHPRISILALSRLTGLTGEPGNFKATVKSAARRVDGSRCTGCGVCASVCPMETTDAYNCDLGPKRAIGSAYPQAVPNTYYIQKDVCLGCGLCAEVCQAKAISYLQEGQENVLEVDAVVAAPGLESHDPSALSAYGYGRYANVVTSMEFERMLSASGPHGGLTLRPSDGRIPRNMAMIHCVGSRQAPPDRSYCSSACCMFLVKEAVVAMEHVHGLTASLFYIDMRSYGKGFDRYVERARNEYGVEFIRSRVSHIEELPGGDLNVRYADAAGRPSSKTFQMVVLGTALTPPPEVKQLGEALGVEMDRHGFCVTDDFEPLSSSRPGVFVAGGFAGPKDIPESVVQGSAAAGLAGALAARVAPEPKIADREPKPKIAEEPEPAADEAPTLPMTDPFPPRVGVFVCRCGINIGGYVDVPAVVKAAERMPNVVFAGENLFTCSEDTQQRIKEVIQEHGLNRVVVASCTPRTHEPLFMETCLTAGLNPYLFEMANIRDQCSWVHMRDKEMGTQKAVDLVQMAVMKVLQAEPLEELTFPVTPAALVVGGGPAGLTAAADLAGRGFDVHLVEKERLGGHLTHLHWTLEGKDTRPYLDGLIKKVETDSRIHVHLQSEVKESAGFVGNFETTIRKQDGTEIKVAHGVTIVAIGARADPEAHPMAGRHPAVLTQTELAAQLGEGKLKPPKQAVFIQCVGSRTDDRPYCSRHCCSAALRHALELKNRHPDTRILVLYRDMRTYAFHEDLYIEARKQGVTFVRYSLDRPPELRETNGTVNLRFFEPMIRREVDINPDLVCLSVATICQPETEALAQNFKVPTDADGFFLEAHVKLRPIDCATEGIYLAGSCHGPKTLQEAAAQARGAAGRASLVLSAGTVKAAGRVAEIRAEFCAACGACVELCPATAIEFVEDPRTAAGRYARVRQALCLGCGTCVSACRGGASDLKGFTSRAILSALDVLEEGWASSNEPSSGSATNPPDRGKVSE